MEDYYDGIGVKTSIAQVRPRLILFGGVCF